MTDSITIPLSEHQRARFASYDQQLEAIQARATEALSVLVAGVMDPAVAQSWTITRNAVCIVCTPPFVPDVVAPPTEGVE